MAQSIKLTDDKYWDISSIHGIEMYSQRFTVGANASKSITIPSNYRGFAVTLGLTGGVDAWSIIGILAQGSSNIQVKEIVASANVSISRNGMVATISNSSAYILNVIVIGTHLLSV